MMSREAVITRELSPERRRRRRRGRAPRRAGRLLLALLPCVLAWLGCGFSGDDEGESDPSSAELLAPEQEARITEVCHDECVANAEPDQPAWLRGACESGCAIRVRGEMRSGTFAEAAHVGDFPDCPNGAACMNGCLQQCQSAHGPMNDLGAMRGCINRPGATAADCAGVGINQATTNCFRECRNHP